MDLRVFPERPRSNVLKTMKQFPQLKPSRNDPPHLFNEILNRNEIQQKKTILSSHPLYLWVTLTNRCNLQCIMCSVPDKRWEISDSHILGFKRLFPYLQEVRWQ